MGCHGDHMLSPVDAASCQMARCSPGKVDPACIPAEAKTNNSRVHSSVWTWFTSKGAHGEIGGNLTSLNGTFLIDTWQYAFSALGSAAMPLETGFCKAIIKAWIQSHIIQVLPHKPGMQQAEQEQRRASQN